MHCLLLSNFPFYDKDSAVANRKVCDEDLDLDLFKSLSSQCRDLLIKMLSKDVEDRLTINEVLQHPWLS